MTNARSNFLRRKKVLAQERKKRCNDILTSAWIHEQTKDEGIEWLRCSRCHYTYSLTTNQLERYEYPCMCPLCNRYMLGVRTNEQKENRDDTRRLQEGEAQS